MHSTQQLSRVAHTKLFSAPRMFTITRHALRLPLHKRLGTRTLSSYEGHTHISKAAQQQTVTHTHTMLHIRAFAPDAAVCCTLPLCGKLVHSTLCKTHARERE